MSDLEIRKFDIREANWSQDQSVLSNLRRIVFIIEQSVPQEEEWDGQDEDAWHWLASDPAGKPIGTARLLPSGQIGRMAVLQEYRGLKVGRAMLEAAVEKARRLGFQNVFLNAQSHALEFYKKSGFIPEGEEFMEAGIAHFRMQQALSLPEDQQQRKLQTGDIPDVAIRRFDTAEVSWRSGGKLIRALRKPVFQAELGLGQDYVEDAFDPEQIHFHCQLDQQTIGAIRMDLEGSISRLCVDSGHRHQGVGTALLEAVIAKGRRFGLKHLTIHDVPESLGAFLSQSGFSASHEAGQYERRLDDVAAFHRTRSNLGGTAYDSADASYRLGETAGFLLLRREDEFRRVIEAMCQQASQSIQIMSPLLDHKLFDSTELYEICSSLGRKNKYTRIEILLYDSHRVVKHGHGLLDIARRLPSSIGMRIVHPELRSSNHEYVLVDDAGLIYRQDYEQYEGYANFKDVTEANRLRRQFRAAWESGLQDPNLRQLKI
ncbi:MAG: GNAT family N-acetyltransferase [Pseudomonadales bacterium]